MNMEATAGRLSAGATAQLEEFAQELRAGILAEAVRLNPNDVLTTRDISDAYRAYSRVSHEAELAAFRLAQRLRWSRVLMVYSVMTLVAAACATALAVYGSVVPSGSSWPLYVTIAAFAGMAAISAMSIILIAVRESRSARVRALHEAEASRSLQRVYEDSSTAQTESEPVEKDREVLLGRFIYRWGRLEDRIRRLAQVGLGMDPQTAADYPIGGLLRSLIRIGVLEPKRGEDIQDVLDVRNLVAHGRDVSLADLSVGVSLMKRLETFLDDAVAENTLS